MSLIGPYFANIRRRSSGLLLPLKFRMYSEVFGGRAYLFEDILFTGFSENDFCNREWITEKGGKGK